MSYVILYVYVANGYIEANVKIVVLNIKFAGGYVQVGVVGICRIFLINGLNQQFARERRFHSAIA